MMLREMIKAGSILYFLDKESNKFVKIWQDKES